MRRKAFFPLLVLASTISISSANAFAFYDEEEFAFGNTLVDAADQGNYEIVEAFLEQGKNPNESGKFETSALHRAAFNGNDEIARMLIQAGADINIRDYGGAAPLHISARQGTVNLTEILVRNGADINAQDDQGYTPLHRAVAGNQTPISLYLIAAGANVNTVNNEGNSPLIDAVKIANPTLVKELILKGANKSVKNSQGLDAIDYALKVGNKNIDVLLTKNANEVMTEQLVSQNVVTANYAPQYVSAEPVFMQQEQAVAAVPTFLQQEVSTPKQYAAVKVDTAFVSEEPIEPIELNAAPAAAPTPVAAPAPHYEAPVYNTQQAYQQQIAYTKPEINNLSTLQKAPRLPSSGELPQNLKQQYKAADKIQSQPQIVQVTTTQQMAPDALWAETPNNAIRFGGDNTSSTTITHYVNTQPSLEDISNDYAQNNVATTKSDAPASMKNPAPATSGGWNYINTSPVPAMQVTRPQVPPAQPVVAQQPRIDTNYASEVDALMNNVESVKIDKAYEAQVDDLFNQVSISAPAPRVQPAIYSQPEYFANKQTVFGSQNPSASGIPSYNTYKSDLIQNINEFYNSGSAPAPAAPQNNFIPVTPIAAPAVPVPVVKTTPFIPIDKKVPDEFIAENTGSVRNETPVVPQEVESEDLKKIEIPASIAAEQPAEPAKLDVKSSSGDNDLTGIHALVGEFDRSEDAIAFYNDNSSKSGLIYTYKIVKSKGSSKFSLAIGKLADPAEAGDVCESFKNRHDILPDTGGFRGFQLHHN
jgi:ankyrin repeat protein